MNLLGSNRKKANRELQEICRKLYTSIPMTDLVKAMETGGVTPTQEDGTRWSGLICGREGRVIIPLATVEDGGKPGFPIRNSVLVLSWFKHETGRYEVNAYLS